MNGSSVTVKRDMLIKKEYSLEERYPKLARDLFISMLIFIIFYLVCTTHEIYLLLEYNDNQIFGRGGTMTVMPHFISSLIVIAVLAVGLDRKPLIIYKDSVSLPLRRFEMLFRKCLIYFDNIEAVYLKRHFQPLSFIRPVPPWEIWRRWKKRETIRYRIGYGWSTGYPPYIYKVWVETNDGKQHFLAYKKDWLEIMSLLKKAYGDNWNMIKVDEELLKLGE